MVSRKLETRAFQVELLSLSRLAVLTSLLALKMFALPTRARASSVTHTVLVLCFVTLANAAETRYSTTLASSSRNSASRTNVVATRSPDVDDQPFARVDLTTGARVTQTPSPKLGLAPCGGDDPGCFVMHTPFPSNVGPTRSCAADAAPTVTLAGANVVVTSHAFDGEKLTFQVDIRAALLAANVTAGDTPVSLQARAQLVCPKDTLDAGKAGATQTSRAGTWIFPFNFFLLEEIALLADSIEGLVEAVDELEITMTGDDGSEKFLYAGFEDTPFQLEPARDEGDGENTVDGFFGSITNSLTNAFQSAQDTAQGLTLDLPQLGNISA